MLKKLLYWLLIHVAKEQPKIVTKTYVRISPEVLAAYRNKMAAHTVVNSSTTDIQAGWNLGVQHAIRIFSEDILID